MRRLKTTLLLALASAGTTLTLGACGGDESSSSSTTPTAADTVAETGPTATATQTATTPAASDTGNGGAKTPPETELKIGEAAHVTIKPLDAKDEDKKTYKLDAVVQSIEKGSIDDLKNIDLDAAQKKSTPYYMKVKVTNTGSKNIPVTEDDPDVRFDATDDRGQDQGSVTVFGDFERCDDRKAPDPFKPGDSYESCLTYLIAGGGSIKAGAWSGSPEYILTPVVWK